MSTLCRRFLSAVLLLISLAHADALLAQTPVLRGMMPDSIVVTASRAPSDVRFTGQRVAVWTARDLEALPVSSFDELLRTVGGIEAQSRGGFGVQSDLTMRGSTFNGVLLLIDGVRFNDPMTNHFLTDFPVPLTEIARIEVLRGPAASLYGPDALGGVVHIMTHTGLRASRIAARGVEAEVEGMAGSEASFGGDATVRYGRNQTLFSASLAGLTTDGEIIRDAEGQPVMGNVDPLRTDAARVAGSVALAHRPSAETSLFVRAGLDDRDFNAYHFYTDFASDRAREATRTAWAQGRLRSDLATRTTLVVDVAAKQHEDTYVYNPGSTPSRHTSRLGLVQARVVRTLTPRLTGIVGASGQVRSIDSNVMNQHNDAATGGYALLRWRPALRWGVNVSGRVDYDESYGTEATPQLNLAYTRGPLTLRGGIGRAVRAPNYVERYLDSGGNFGNPVLEAERAWSYEAGVSLYGQGVDVHLTAFARTTDNLIDYALVPGDSVFRARNILEVETRGLEVDAAVTRTLGPARVRTVLAYTLLDATLNERVPGARYKYALSSARHLLQATTSAQVGTVQVGLQALWKDRREATSYGVVHLRGAWRVPVDGLRLHLTAEVRNVFDVAYAEVFDAPMPGRWVLAGLRLGR